jgi:hypothetical protein
VCMRRDPPHTSSCYRSELRRALLKGQGRSETIPQRLPCSSNSLLDSPVH